MENTNHMTKLYRVNRCRPAPNARWLARLGCGHELLTIWPVAIGTLMACSLCGKTEKTAAQREVEQRK
jgi:hypothetical protein